MSLTRSLLSAAVMLALSTADASAAPGRLPAGTPGIDLSIGIAEYDGSDDQCGTATQLTATLGDQIDVCYTVTNRSSVILNYQSLVDDVFGNLLEDAVVAVEPGASYRFNRIYTPRTSQSPTATWTAQDELPGYTATAASVDFTDISATGTALDLGDEDGESVPLPIAFPFYGQSAAQVCVSNNGHLTFGNQYNCSGDYENVALPYAGFPVAVVMPFWDDLYNGGNVYVETLGEQPDRRFIVEWFQKNHYDANLDDPGGVTFEVVLNEADDSLDFIYRTVEFDALQGADDNGRSATIGLQDAQGLYNQYSFDTASVSDGQSIHWTTSSPNVYVASQQITLDLGAPVLTLDATALSASTAAGEAVTVALKIGNAGNRDLAWTIGEAAPDAHFVGQRGTPRHATPPTDVERRRADLMRVAPAKATSATKQRTATGTAAVPAFIIDEGASGFQFGSVDAAAPATFAAIAPLSSAVIYRSGAFVANDFSREFVAGDSPDITVRQIATIDVASGAVTAFANSAPREANEIWNGLKWDSSTSTLYGLACDPLATTGECHLYYVDPLNGSVQEGPALSGFSGAFFPIDIAIDTRGLMYAIDIYSGDLLAIDKDSGVVDTIGNTGVSPNFAQSLAFDAATNTLYWPSYDLSERAVMYTVDTLTGAVHAVGNLLGGDDQLALVIARADGPCAQPADVPWLSESSAGEVTAAGAESTLNVTFDSRDLAPGTYSATLCVDSNDPDHRQTALPVAFVVSAVIADRVFADGFDGLTP